MDERLHLRLDDNDLIAAAQILSWIALPHRPQDGVDLLCNWYWARQKFLGHPLPDLPFALKKPSRLESQLRRLEATCLVGFRAGIWLNWKILSASPSPWFSNIHMSTRKLASRRASTKGTESHNEIRDVWSKRKPVAHMALAAANAIGGWLKENDLYEFGLSGAILHPEWVSEAIEMSEEWRRSASRFIDPATFHRFHRDSF